MNRIEALAKLLGINQEQISSRFIKEDVDSGVANEYYVEENGESIYYDVLKEDEIHGRLESMFEAIYSGEEIFEMYGTTNAAEAAEEADISLYLSLVGTIRDYQVYTAEHV